MFLNIENVLVKISEEHVVSFVNCMKIRKLKTEIMSI